MQSLPDQGEPHKNKINRKQRPRFTQNDISDLLPLVACFPPSTYCTYYPFFLAPSEDATVTGMMFGGSAGVVAWLMVIGLCGADHDLVSTLEKCVD